MRSGARSSRCPPAPVLRSAALAVLLAAAGAARADPEQPAPGPAAAQLATPGAPAPAPMPVLAPVWLDVVANEVPRGTFLVHLSGRDVWVAADDLERIGLQVTGGERIEQAGRSLVSLSSLPALLTFKVDEAALALLITAKQPILGRTRLDLARLTAPKGMLRRDDVTSAYLNWAVAGDSDERRSATSELGVVVGPAMLTAGGTMDREHGPVRGLTSLVLDDDRRLVRVTAGDLVTPQGDLLGGATVVGGLSAGRSFALDPYLPLAPYPRTTVFSPTPSTLEVWVDGSLVKRQVLAPGTVDLENIPVNAGLSEIRTVLRDAFGREQSASTFALFGSTTLAPGLVDWSAATGLRRERFGVESFDYGRPVAQGRLRAGLTRILTAGARLEGGDGLVSGGGSLSLAVPFGELEGALAASRSQGETGGAAALAWRTSSRRAGAVVQLRWDSGHYANVSQDALGDRPVLRGSVSGSLTIVPRVALLGELSATHARDGGEAVRGLARLWWAHRTGVSTSLSVARTVRSSAPGLAAPAVTELFLTVSAPLPGRTTAELAGGAGSAAAAEYGQVALTRSMRPGPDVGYRLVARGGDGALARADLQAQNRFARAEVSHAQSDPWTGQRRSYSSAQLASGFVLVGGRVLPTRPVEGSFALVSAGAADVTVLHEGVPVGRTDARGELLVTNLMPYYGNRLGVRDADYPMEWRVDEIERVIAPRERGGTVERFRAARVTVVTGRLALVVDGRELAPEWGEIAVELPGRRAVSPVGEGGLFWLEAIPPGRHDALLRWEGRLCRFTFQVPDDAAATQDLGPVRCEQLL